MGGRETSFAYADGGGAEFDCFEGVFDLEETAFWGEGAGEMVRIWLFEGGLIESNHTLYHGLYMILAGEWNEMGEAI